MHHSSWRILPSFPLNHVPINGKMAPPQKRSVFMLPSRSLWDSVKKNELEDYWETYHLSFIPFTEVMARNRYELVTSFLHFQDNTRDQPACTDPTYDPLWQVRPLLNLVDDTYMRAYTPERELSIDDSIARYKGRLSFRQFLPKKPIQFGIKQFVVCEIKTGYALKFLAYCGKGTVELRDGFTITETVCLELLSNFTNLGHHVFTDTTHAQTCFFSWRRMGLGPVELFVQVGRTCH